MTDAVAASGPVRLDDLVEQMIALLSTEASVNELSLAWGARRDPAVILADRHGAGRQILTEILTAMQRAGRGGQLRLEVRIDPERERGAVVIRAIMASEERLLPVELAFPLIP